MQKGSKLNPCTSEKELKKVIKDKKDCNIFVKCIFDISQSTWKIVRDNNIKLYPIIRK